MTQGTILSYNPEKKSGYVRLDTADDDVVFDLEDVVDYPERGAPEKGQKVSVEMTGGMIGIQVSELRRV